jgi:SRSO17 transposase
MQRRFRVRMDELLSDAKVSRGLLRGVMPRLETFLEPFVAALRTVEQRTNARHYVSGLISDLDSKDVESISYLHDRERQGLQKFIGQSPWDHRPLLAELTRQVATQLGQADGVLVFDPSAFAKQGSESVGVQRQWCGRLGKIDNCQVGIYLGYVSDRDHALVDFRLYLRERRVWQTTRFAHGRASIIIKLSPYWQPGSSHRRPGGEKIRTPALTVCLVRRLIAGVLNRLLGCHRAVHIRRNTNRRLRRNEEARLYHWKRRHRLPSRRFEQRN